MKRKTFPRGIHPPQLKVLTAIKPIERMPVPEKVYVPLVQHFGKPAKSLVKKGDAVTMGQKIGEQDSLFSASIHSPVSGRVQGIDLHNHPCGIPAPAVIIQNDGQDLKIQEQAAARDPFAFSPDEIRQRIREAGVVGLGGAAFPTAVKLAPPRDKPVDTIIINGCECEPLLTGDYRLMLESPADILKGAELIRIAASAQKIIVGIEDNKSDAVDSLRINASGFPVEFALLKTKYPQGAEKNLIYAILQRQVPRGGLPFDVGVVVQNVGTAKAVWEAVISGKPLYERVITCSGPGIKDPKNLLVRVGTQVKGIIDFCGGLNDGVDMLTLGGPMMGLSQWALDIPVVKGTSGILALVSQPEGHEYPCIRCARCVDHCPMGLVPTKLAKLVQFERFDDAEKWGNMDCVECGCCQYMCPARIPLVHWIRLGKKRIADGKRKKGPS